MRIKDISEENRPRERLQKLGPGVLSDSELLAIILQKGTRNENAVDMSNRLVFEGLEKLSEKSLHELKQTKGVGLVKATQIIALFELGKRCRYKINNKKTIMSCAKDVFDYAAPKIRHLKQENFMVILLDCKNKVIKDEIVSIGILNAALVHPREIFRTAIKESANSIIIAHNHPSGDCSPSDEDYDITEKIKKAGKTVGINVLDSVIIGDCYKSIK